MSKQKAIVILEHLRDTHQFFCFSVGGVIHTAEELMTLIEGRKVSFDEAVDYITNNSPEKNNNSVAHA